ncbi:MAG TPA: DNA polymerase III subunit delta [Thiobacillaceae bacterium]|nr:DNA polymerase III subunit delta [Thiobacillaceae bacterium]HNU64319.1 DNA polymerase III subunit delta [Thiobacillaceae bacterium]
MRIRAERLSAILKADLAPLWLVSGDEPLLVDEAMALIRTTVQARGHAERRVEQAETGFDWRAWMAGFDSLSLFASRRLVELCLPTGKPGVEGGKVLESWAARPPAETVLVISVPRLDRAGLAVKWVKAVEAAGVLVQCWPPGLERLPAWIGERLARHGLKADPETLAWLAARVEGNLLAAHQEIEKLALLLPVGALDLETARACVADVARYDVSDLSEAFLKGDAVRFCHTLDGLRAEGERLPLVLAVFGGDVRTLYRLERGLQQGERLSGLMTSLRVWESRQDLVERALRRTDGQCLALAMRALARLDRAAKGLLREDAWDELKQLGLILMRRGQAPAFAAL